MTGRMVPCECLVCGYIYEPEKTEPSIRRDMVLWLKIVRG